MLRHTVTATIVAFAAVSSTLTSATILNLAYERPPGNGSTCAGIIFSIPRTDTTQVATVESVNLPANTVVLFEHCNSTSSELKTLNASDPSTWAVGIDWPCFSVRINATEEELDCDHKSITLDWVKTSDFCKNSNASESVCRGSSATSSSNGLKLLSPFTLALATVATGLTTAWM